MTDGRQTPEEDAEEQSPGEDAVESTPAAQALAEEEPGGAAAVGEPAAAEEEHDPGQSLSVVPVGSGDRAVELVRSPDEEARGEEEKDAPFAYLDAENHRRLDRVMSEWVPEVFRLNRAIEQRTGYQSEIGRNMLVDVLSHLGTLASRQNLTPAEQATQLSKIEEHLRRAIIEHPEEVVRERIVEVRNLWSEYQREAFLYREQGLLRGVPRHSDLEESRKRIDLLMETARSVKPDETSWEESLNAAAAMTEAAHLTGELADKLEQCIGEALRITKEREQVAVAAKRDKKSTRLWIVGIAVAVALAIGAYLAGKHESSSQAGSSKPHTTTSAPAPGTRTPTGKESSGSGSGTP